MRQSKINRKTNETTIQICLNLDEYKVDTTIQTGIGFFDHMLSQIAKHARIHLSVEAKGDYHIDDHHTVEDVGIALGMAFSEALGNKQGIQRFAEATVPLDESLTRSVIDFSGRPGLHYFMDFPVDKIGQFDTQLIREFFQGFVNHAQVTLHLDNIRGENAHHIAESAFKAFARSIKAAISSSGYQDIPSTKGSL